MRDDGGGSDHDTDVLYVWSQSNFGALDFELTEAEMQKLSSLKFQKRLVDGSMVCCN